MALDLRLGERAQRQDGNSFAPRILNRPLNHTDTDAASTHGIGNEGVVDDVESRNFEGVRSACRSREDTDPLRETEV